MEAARPAGAADLARLAELWLDAEAELRPMRGGDVFFAQVGRPEPVVASLEADLGDPPGDGIVMRLQRPPADQPCRPQPDKSRELMVAEDIAAIAIGRAHHGRDRIDDAQQPFVSARETAARVDGLSSIAPA